VGGLSHYLEDEGLATTQISLVREHTEQIKPPRALWVPFELGRPLGVPNDSEFQARVLKSALTLLKASRGPVLEDFSEDAPFRETDGGPPACPVDFRPKKELITELDHLLSEFKQEFDQMHNWYNLSKNHRGRTTADSSGLDPEMTAEFITRFIRGETPAQPLPEASLGTNIKMAVEDLKAYYTEAVTSQPGQPTDSTALADWFWSRTTAAQVINEVRKRCMIDDDEHIKRIGSALLIPKSQLHRFGG
jgi:hypothetical protein